MRSRHILSAASALTMGFALVLSSAPAAVAAPAKPAPSMLEALQRDLNLSAEQAQLRLVNEARLGKLEGKVRTDLGASFGGSWLSGDTANSLTVATSDASKIAAIQAGGAKAQLVTRSLGDLTALKDKLDAASAPQTVPVYYVDVKTNSVVVETRDQAAAEAFVAASGVDKAAVRYVATNEQPVTYYDLRGGDAYYINNSGRCSIGFSITRGTTPASSPRATAATWAPPPRATTAWRRAPSRAPRSPATTTPGSRSTPTGSRPRPWRAPPRPWRARRRRSSAARSAAPAPPPAGTAAPSSRSARA